MLESLREHEGDRKPERIDLINELQTIIDTTKHDFNHFNYGKIHILRIG